MRALPGSELRVRDAAALTTVTRETAHADQRRRLLRAIGELVAERGYADVTIELIVKRARVSYKTFYKHFSDKEDCFHALFDEVFEATEELIREHLDREARPWPDQVALALGAWIEWIVAEPQLARAVIVEAATVGPAMRERYEQTTQLFVPLFRQGRELSSRGDELPATLEETLAGSVFWSAYQRLVINETDRLAALLPEVIEMVLRTYLGQAEARRLADAKHGPHAIPA